MTTWLDLANEAQQDAATLKSGGRLRAALNRCYYSLFSGVAFAASKSGYTMPTGWEGPSHEAVYEGGIVANHLRSRLGPSEQSRLIFIAAVLYKLRRDADYSPAEQFTDAGSTCVRTAAGSAQDSGGGSMNNVDLSKIVELINDRLRQTELGRSFDLRVEPELTRSEDPWVYVGVAPHRIGVRAYELAELLATVEQDVRAQAKKPEILLVPVRIDGSTNGKH